RWRPQHTTRMSQRVVAIAQAEHRRPGRRLLRASLLLGPRAQYLGQPPVHDLHFPEAPYHHIGWLEVAVDDVVGMGVGQRLAHLLERRHEPAAILGGVTATL